MELRPDIATAASRITSGFDVNREIRQLSAYLRDGETVHLLTSGVYGTGSGLLAVTDHRVLLLRDGRSGQASEGFPLERLSAVEWAVMGARGTIAVSDSNSTAELTHVDPTEGAEVVGLVRSLMPPEEPDGPGGRRPWTAVTRRPVPADEPATPSHASATLPTGAVSTAAGAGAGLAANDNPVARPVERTGPYAVQMRLRTPTPADQVAARQSEQVSRSGPISRSGPVSQSGPAAEQSAVEQSGPSGTSREQASHFGLPPGAVPIRSLGTEQSGALAADAQVAASSTGLAATPPDPNLMVGEVSVAQLAEETCGVRAVSTETPDTASTPTGTGGHRTASRRSSSGASRLDSATGPTRAESRTSPAGAPSGRGPIGRPSSRRGRSTRGRVWLGGAAIGLAGLAGLGCIALIAAGPDETPVTEVNPAPTAADSAAGPVVTISKVVDADTVEVSGPVNGMVEILGIVGPRADKGQCGAEEATGFAVRTLTGTTVTLISDPSQPATDKSGRRLAFLRTQNGSDYSVLAVRSGMARYYDSGNPVALASEIKAAQAEAEDTNLGLWGPPCNGKVSAAGAASNSNASGSAGADTPSRSSSGATRPARAVAEEDITSPR